MANERIQRRLVAILAADVVGYSRLMERDETGTLADLKSRWNEVVEPLVARYDGRIFKRIGDGILVEFGSAVSAVECAAEVQEAMTAKNSDSGDRRILLRIGVHLGDVMVDGRDRYGDGSNVASRREARSRTSSDRCTSGPGRQTQARPRPLPRFPEHRRRRRTSRQ
jgi:adenylate cyclase